MSGRGRGKRGVSKGAREFDGAVYEIMFLRNLPCGENRHRFMADFNRLVEKHLNYWEPWNKVKGEPYDHVWSAIKVLWNIPNNDAKKTMRKKANHAFRQFKSFLGKKFVEKENNNPKAKYNVVNMTRWDEFIVSRQSEEFKLKSAKATESALQNKNPSRLGRTGLNDMEDTWRADWDQLVLQHPWLSTKRARHAGRWYILCARKRSNYRSVWKRAWGTNQGVSTVHGVRTTLGWAKGDKEINQIVDIEAIQEKVTKTVTAAFQDKFDSQKNEIKSQKNEIEGLKATMARLQGRESLTCLGSSSTSDGFDDLEDPTPCDLLWPWPEHEFRVAIGKVYPTRDATLCGSSMSEGYVKVQVDTIEDAFKAIPVPKETESVHQLEQSILEFIEWPRNKIKQEDLMTFQHQGSYMSLLKSQGELDPQILTSWPQMLEQPMSSRPVTNEPAKPNQTQEERYKERLDELKGMYVGPWEEWIEYEAILDLHINAKIDISFIHWWAIRLHLMVKSIPNNKCIFLNPHIIQSSECRNNGKNVMDHIIAAKGLHAGKEIYVAPYLQGRHWLLFVVCPNLRKGYIVDSNRYVGNSEEEERCEEIYYFPEIIERALEIKFDWTLAKCHQQEGTWECGYYLKKFMHDLAINKQGNFPESLWDNTRRLTLSEINQVALMTLNEFYRLVVFPLDTKSPQ